MVIGTTDVDFIYTLWILKYDIRGASLLWPLSEISAVSIYIQNDLYYSLYI